MSDRGKAKRGRGRPRILESDRRIQVSVSLRSGDVARLRRLARERGVPFSSLFQGLISRFLAERGA